MESRRKRSRSQILKWSAMRWPVVCAALQTTPGLFQLGQAKPLFLLPLCLAVSVCEGRICRSTVRLRVRPAVGLHRRAHRGHAGTGTDAALLCRSRAGAAVPASAPATFASSRPVAALLVLSCDWLFFYTCPATAGVARATCGSCCPRGPVPSGVAGAVCIVRHIYTNSRSTTAWSDRRRNADEPKRTQNRSCAGWCCSSLWRHGHGPVRVG